MGYVETPKRYDPRRPYAEATNAEVLFLVGFTRAEVKAILAYARGERDVLAERLGLPEGWSPTWKPPWSHIGGRPACGAKTRQGTPCRNTCIYTNGRCKNHGGLSTGPKTTAGRARALSNLKHYRGNAKADGEKELPNFDEFELTPLGFDLERTGLTDEDTKASGTETRAQRRELRETIKMLRRFGWRG